MLNPSDLRKAIFAGVFFVTLAAQADWIVGGFVGFGGAGIKSTVTINATDVPVERSDSPGVFGFFIERSLSENSSLALDHTSGFTLAPYESGVEFNGFTYKYFYPGEMPSVKVSKNESSFLVQKFEPFIGGSFGVAKGVINRQNDLVPSISASGAYFGFHIGADYQLAPGIVTRTEMIVGSSMAPSGFAKATLSEFGLVSGLYYIW
jgi:hypothetical protein